MIATSTRPMIHVPTARLMPIGRICRAYATEVKYECLRMLRAPAFSIPFLLLPVPVYLFFGVMLAGPAVAKNPGVANYLFSGFSVFAVMGPALFGAACVLVMTIGAIPFAAIGLFIGAHTSGSSAPTFANLIFLPMLWLSGLFIPLPKFLERLAVIWPAFHLNQVALGSAGIREFSFLSPAISAAVLVGFTVIFGGLAIRRLARHG